MAPGASGTSEITQTALRRTSAPSVQAPAGSAATESPPSRAIAQRSAPATSCENSFRSASASRSTGTGAPSDRIRTACCLRATLSESRSRIRSMTRRTSCQSAGGEASMARSRSSSSRSWARRYSVHRIVNVTPSGEAVCELVMSFRCQDPDRGLCGQRLDVRACRVVQPRPQHHPRHALSAGVDLAVTAKLVARSGERRSPGHDLCPPTARRELTVIYDAHKSPKKRSYVRRLGHDGLRT